MVEKQQQETSSCLLISQRNFLYNVNNVTRTNAHEETKFSKQLEILRLLKLWI